MERCYSRLKSIIQNLHLSKKYYDNLEGERAQESDIDYFQKRIEYYLKHAVHSKGDDFQDFSSVNISKSSTPIQAVERLDHIRSWPAWKCSLDSRRRDSGPLDMSWILDRLPNPTPFESMWNVEQIMMALKSSYQNCIFEGRHRSQNPTSALYRTTLDKIAKSGSLKLSR